MFYFHVVVVVCHQIRVFVHSTSGHVVEQDLSATSPTKTEVEATIDSTAAMTATNTPQQGREESGGEGGSEGSDTISAHNCTIDKSLAMEMTMYETEVETEEVTQEGEGKVGEFTETPYLEQVGGMMLESKIAMLFR